MELDMSKIIRLPIITLNLDTIWPFRLEWIKWVFTISGQILTLKLKNNASRHTEMLVFCVNRYFQLQSTSLGYVQTDFNHHMVIKIGPTYWIFREFFKKWSFLNNSVVKKLRLQTAVFLLLLTLFISQNKKIQKVAMGILCQS